MMPSFCSIIFNFFFLVFLLPYHLQVLGVPTTRSKVIPVKTIQDGDDVFDCVDIYKQPAFDHPLLKNHKIQTKPNFCPQRSTNEASPKSTRFTSALKSLACPHGTVPIHRVRKDVRTKSLYNHSLIQPLDGDKTILSVARLRISDTNEVLYYGVSATINIENPKVNDDQYSSGQVWIENWEEGTGLDTLQAGWIVAPELFQDARTRFFILWSTQNVLKNETAGCYNLECPGFIVVSNVLGLGSVLVASTPGDLAKQKYLYKLVIRQDNSTKNWWLQIEDADLKQINIGYWPASILPHLSQEGTTRAAWGASVTLDKNGISPDMGTGQIPDADHDSTTVYHIYDALLLDKDGQWTPPNHSIMIPQVDSQYCQVIADHGDLGIPRGYTTFFGGKGGVCPLGPLQ